MSESRPESTIASLSDITTSSRSTALRQKGKYIRSPMYLSLHSLESTSLANDTRGEKTWLPSSETGVKLFFTSTNSDFWSYKHIHFYNACSSLNITTTLLIMGIFCLTKFNKMLKYIIKEWTHVFAPWFTNLKLSIYS